MTGSDRTGRVSEPETFSVFDPAVLPGKLVFTRRRDFQALRPPDVTTPISCPSDAQIIDIIVAMPAAQAGGTYILIEQAFPSLKNVSGVPDPFAVSIGTSVEVT